MTTTEATPAKKPMLGRNQWIGTIGTALPILLGFGLVLAGKLDAEKWLGFSQTITATGVGTTLGVSGLVKAVEAFRAK